METRTIFCALGIAAILAWRILYLLWFKPKRIEKFLRDQGLKGTPYQFVYGDSNQVQSKPMSITDHDIAPLVVPAYHKSVTDYGKTSFTWLGNKPMLYISEPSMIREVLGNQFKFHLPDGGSPLSRFLTRGLATVEADEWVKHRKIINPAFHVEKLKHMLPAFYECSNEMINKWEELVTKERSCEVDVWPHIHTLTADAISRTAFGSSFEVGRKIDKLQRELGELVINAISTMYIPGSHVLPTKSNKRIKEIDRNMTALIKGIIDKRMIAMDAGETSNDDLLGILLDSNCKEIKQHGSSNFGLSIDEVIDECKLFYSAGRATGNLLVWTMILLGQHTDWQTRAREEVLQVFGEKIPDIDGMNRLKVVSMIFNEVLRLYPVVVYLRRMVPKETKLKNVILPAGTLLQINKALLNHDKEIWGEDVNEFNPERFSEGVLKATNGQAVYLPFGGGGRICIGQNFAMLEAKMALSMILQRFSFNLSSLYTHSPCTIITLQPQHGAPLILHKI